jgi:hypothetical protein
MATKEYDVPPTENRYWYDIGMVTSELPFGQGLASVLADAGLQAGPTACQRSASTEEADFTWDECRPRDLSPPPSLGEMDLPQWREEMHDVS